MLLDYLGGPDMTTKVPVRGVQEGQSLSLILRKMDQAATWRKGI